MELNFWKLKNRLSSNSKIQQKVSDAISNDTSEGILVKDGGILPGAESLNLQTPPKLHPFGHPRLRRSNDVLLPLKNSPGLGNVPGGPTVRTFTEVKSGVNGNRGD